jgi:internalin A
LLAGLLCALPSCEEPQSSPNKPPPSAAAVAKSPAPAPLPSAPKPPAPSLPKKKLEDCPKSNQVVFEQAGLEEPIRAKLQKPTGPLTKADLKQLKSANFSSVKLDQLDICLFSQMSGIKELFLGPGDYDDLSPIATSTQLTSLRASMSHVRNLAPLEKMTKLDRLDLGRTEVADLSPLSGLVELTELLLDNTPVEDVAPLAKLAKLERLSIKQTRIKDVSGLKGLKKLKFVYVAGSPVENEPTSLAAVRANGTQVLTE